MQKFLYLHSIRSASEGDNVYYVKKIMYMVVHYYFFVTDDVNEWFYGSVYYDSFCDCFTHGISASLNDVLNSDLVYEFDKLYLGAIGVNY